MDGTEGEEGMNVIGDKNPLGCYGDTPRNAGTARARMAGVCGGCGLRSDVTQRCGCCGRELCPASGCYTDWWALACGDCREAAKRP